MGYQRLGFGLWLVARWRVYCTARVAVDGGMVVGVDIIRLLDSESSSRS